MRTNAMKSRFAAKFFSRVQSFASRHFCFQVKVGKLPARRASGTPAKASRTKCRLRPAEFKNEETGVLPVSRLGQKLKLGSFNIHFDYSVRVRQSFFKRDCWHQPSRKRHHRNV
mmetsp:Transcript_48827/g.116182  ORF Transcript_48827/g.116182 Transcript_48827/m.116182 type:complete len:114 (+) Transcript_48827:644-985(+)